MTVDPQFWDGLAERYAARPVSDPEAFERKIAITRGHLSPGAVMLNVGCGTGSLSMRLADTGAALHGIDISGEMLRIARDKARDTPNVTFHQGTLADAPFGPESLDVLAAYSLLHLLGDRETFLQEALALLKPGGVFISSTVCLGGSWKPYGAMITVMRWLGKAPFVDILTHQEVSEAIAAAGFVDIEAPDVGAKDPVICFLVARKPA